MKSNKQRRAELKAKKAAKRIRAERAVKLEASTRGVAVERTALAPDNRRYYAASSFVARGYYVDLPFECEKCGKPQTWTAAQQKWWYEVAKGGVFTTARLCRSCRQRERARREEARRLSLEGLERKRLRE
jgi:hypothetical protein